MKSPKPVGASAIDGGATDAATTSTDGGS
jgi:hypothetical protein